MRIEGRSAAGIAALVTVFGLAACGGSGSASKSSASTTSAAGPVASASSSPAASGSASGRTNACSLVTLSDAGTITGDSDLTQSTVAGTGVCIYSKAGQPVAAGDAVYVAVYPVPVVNSQTLQSLLNERVSGAGEFRAVSGVGDSAYERTSTGGVGLVFAKGNRVVVIGAGSHAKSGSDMLASIESVAKHAAGQL